MLNDSDVKFDMMDYHYFQLPYYSTAIKLPNGEVTNDFNDRINQAVER